MNSVHLAVVKDGQIQLIDPLSLSEGTKVLISPLDNISDDWEYFSLQNLNQCYGDNEPEYSLDSIKEYNDNYERR